MPADIRPFGSTEGVGFYWVKGESNIGQVDLVLVAIDPVGEMTETRARAAFDQVASTRGEAVLEHLAGAVSEADARLERRRGQVAKEPNEEPPPPMDPATRRFLEYE